MNFIHSYVELCLYYITCVQLCLYSYVELCILLCRLCDVMVMNNVLFVCNFLYLLPVSLSYLILYFILYDSFYHCFPIDIILCY